MKEELVKKAYEVAKERFAEVGVESVAGFPFVHALLAGR